MLHAQLSLLGHEPAAFDAAFTHAQRTALTHGAWIEHVPGWVSGHATLFDELESNTRWRSGEQRMYDHVVATPRLFAVLPDDGPEHPMLEAMRASLSRRYGQALTRVSLALYRDGRDSVAWHGDRVARRMQQALVATVSLGDPRRFLLRPYGGGESLGFELGHGDLFVMGGSCQRTWQHAIPKVKRAAPRIAVMFRPDWASAMT